MSKKIYGYTVVTPLNPEKVTPNGYATEQWVRDGFQPKGNYASHIVCESSGSVIALKDASDHNLENLVLYGKTTQNGTPTPEAPIELVSAGADGDIAVTVAGKNLIDCPDIALTKPDSRTYRHNLAEPLPAGTYHFRCDCSGTSTKNRLKLVDKDGGGNEADIVNGMATIVVDTHLASLYFYIHSGQADGATANFSKVMLYLGGDSTYEPFKELQNITIPTENGLPGIPVSSGGNYTDENGQQWVTDEVDLARGVYIQRVKQVDWSRFNFGNSNDSNSIFRSTYYTDYLRNFDRKTLLCSHLPAGEDTRNGLNGTLNKGIGVSTYAGNYNAEDSVIYAVFPKALVGTTKESFQAYIAAQEANGTPVKLYYPSVEPIETPLSAEEIEAFKALHTNKPNTTVFNDTGAGQKVEYVADTKAYIDQKIAAISAAVLNA